MHAKFIRKTISLARIAKGKTSPNPLVGAVIVKGGGIIGRGYHAKAGEPHAEINAINNANVSTKGATLYVNLEPCCHHGRTPPCVDAIIKAGIKEVFVGMYDPNPLVSGGGIEKLRDNGIDVIVGVLEHECEKLNESFIKFVTKKLPFVILKSAASLDGKTATASGDSKWITNDRSRRFVHRLRNEVDAILVGSGTLMKDDPHLTVRLDGKRTNAPVRVVLDKSLKIKQKANVLKNMSEVKTIIFTSKAADKKKSANLIDKGAKLISVPEKDGMLNLKSVLKKLAGEGITSVLVEGGSTLHASFVREKLADKMFQFYAPKLIMGDKAKPIFSGDSKDLIKDAISVKISELRKFGDDIMVEYYF